MFLLTKQASIDIFVANCGRSKAVMPAKAKDPTNRDISISTLGAIYEEGVIVFTLGRPQVILKKKETS